MKTKERKQAGRVFFGRAFTRDEWAAFLRASLRQDPQQRAFAIAADRRNRGLLRCAKVSGCSVLEALRLEEERQRAQQEFERVFRGLPRESDRLTVLRWIENHPAMVLSRPVNEDGLVELTVQDIDMAPSRSAVGQLQHWVNNKEKFYLELMKRKPADDADPEDGEGSEEGGVAEHDPTLPDVIKMLDEIGC